MKVYGYTISDETIEQCFALLPNRPTQWQASYALVKLGVPKGRYRTEEAANRLFQKWRKDGRLTYSQKYGWQKIPCVEGV